MKKLKGFTISAFLLVILTLSFCVIKYKHNYTNETPKKENKLDMFQNMAAMDKLNRWNNFKDKNCTYLGKVEATETVKATNSTIEVNVNRNQFECNNGRTYIVPENLTDEIIYNKRSEEYIPKI